MSDKVDSRKGVDETDAQGEGRGDGRMPGSGDLPKPVLSSEFWSDRYKMNHKQRGVAVIINNKIFNPSTGLRDRRGTDVDAGKMYEVFNQLGFEEIKQSNDLKAREMKSLLHAAAKVDYTDSDCFACVILSHGDEGYVYGTDERIEIDELVAPFKGHMCPSLAGKPKLFFIQACRGSQLDDGVDAHDGESDDPVDVRRIPSEADFLMAYSVVPGYYSWRNSDKGSWFMQAVAQSINQHWQSLDLLTMMTRASHKVAHEFESRLSDRLLCGKKQIPCITSMLTKDVFFC